MADFKIPLTVAFNQAIQTNKELLGDKFNPNDISDGYHTFGELYEHRIALFIALCSVLHSSMQKRQIIWKSKKYSDGSEMDGWFILGLSIAAGNQITYHLPIDRWNQCDFATEFPQSPEFDGHTSDDVLERLKKL